MTLYIEHNKRRANCSIIYWEGKWLLAVREGIVPARIVLADLDIDNASADNVRPLSIPLRSGLGDGFVDPRLFTYNGDLYCSYTYEKKWHSSSFQCLAKIKSDGSVIHNRIFKRLKRPYEKNWQFFDYGGELLIEYSIGCEHAVLDLNLKGRGYSPGPVWPYGEIRCSTPPLRQGNEYIALHHSYIGNVWLERRYSVGHYRFEAQPPFKVLYSSMTPFLTVHAPDRPPINPNCEVAFPGSLLQCSDGWLIAYGYYDAWSCLLDLPNLDDRASAGAGRRIRWLDDDDYNVKIWQ